MTPKTRKFFRLAPLAFALALSLSAQAATLGSGLDTAGFDSAVRVQDDLFNATNGGWISKTEIPGDKSRYGATTMLRDLSDERVRKIVEELAAKPQKAGSVEQKIADFYKSYTDLAQLDKAGLAPLKAALAEIDALKSSKEVAAWLGRMQGRLDTPVQLSVQGDFKDPRTNLLQTWQGGLGMPDRDYYLKDDERLNKARAAYEAYLTQLATLAGDKNAAATAKSVLALERAIAETHLAKVDLRDPVKAYNPMTVAELAASSPGMDWQAFLTAAKVGGVAKLSASQPSQVKGVAKLMAEAPLAQWKAYLRLRLIDASADLLPKDFRDAAFAFHGTAITGTTQELPRWQKAITEVNGALGEAVGKVYVARHFPPAYKARMQELVNNLLAAFGESVDALSWMSAQTQAEAKGKLVKYTTKIGYPEEWRNYGALSVKAGDAIGNRARAGRFEWERQARTAGKPVDRKEWGMTPQTVNAYYNPLLNEVVFPAAILQPPMFDMSADDAVNYGAIGAVIGHEISHGFDDEGSQFDGDGKLRSWWTEADRKAFEAIADKLVAQYETYEPLPGKHLNGRLTLGENIADLSGLQIAFKAYKRSLGGKPSPVMGGYTGEQRFFLGFGQVWRDKVREARALQLLTIDPHSPPRFRAMGTAVNHDGFHEAFGTKPGDLMFKPAAERIRIW